MRYGGDTARIVASDGSSRSTACGIAAPCQRFSNNPFAICRAELAEPLVVDADVQQEVRRDVAVDAERSQVGVLDARLDALARQCGQTRGIGGLRSGQAHPVECAGM